LCDLAKLFCGGAGVDVRDRDNNGEIDKGDILKISCDYEVEPGASITIEDAVSTQGTFVDDRNAEITKTDDGLEIRVTKDAIGTQGKPVKLNADGRVVAVTSDGVRKEQANQGGGGGGGGGSGGSDPADPADPANPVTPAQDTTTPTTTPTTDTTNTVADALNEATTANDGSNAESVREADAFRCEFFLRTVRDEQGALRDQYRDDELIVQRFEQCLSEDVLADTIPDRNLPFTGGAPFSLLAGGALLAAGLLLLGRRVIGGVSYCRVCALRSVPLLP
jgi:hypothetical protein